MKPQPATRIRTCRACGRRYEYPLKGNLATRHHCDECVHVAPDIRRIVEKLSARIQALEKALEMQGGG
ncbi:MAG TPA: hypothetical protein PLU30_17665 [Verrucomicrobiae bacterium]|nr:hypothetical protein [Verrucomicrobiae bacterium]